jgi:hypothetical protein
MPTDHDDHFCSPVTFSTGVQWTPTDPKPLDQTPYLAYLDKEEEKVRAMQAELDRDDDYSVRAYNRTISEEG